MFPALRAHAQPTIIRIWQEGHICSDASKSVCMMMSSNANISALLDLCVGIHQSLVNPPHKGQ